MNSSIELRSQGMDSSASDTNSLLRQRSQLVASAIFGATESQDPDADTSLLDKMRKSMQNVQNYNWAWQYWNPHLEQWCQFDCTDCLILEFSYQAYKITGKDKFQSVEIISGSVDFIKMMWRKVDEKNAETKDAIRIASISKSDEHPVRRSQLNHRQRQNGYTRHNPVTEVISNENKLDLTSETNLEWLAFNFRKERASRLSESKRRMILAMFS